MTNIIQELEATHARLEIAFREIAQRWGQIGMVRDACALVEVIEQAEHYLFEAEEKDHEIAVAVRKWIQQSLDNWSR
ncbi:MAG: hypothetical protein AB7G75_29425 [Candidatus Binatia bacterium]